MFARPDSVLRILENRDVMAEGRLASCGAMMGGRLNEANIVMLSRMANNAYDSLGTTAAGDDDGAPNIRAKHESLYTHRLMFTDDIAKNFVGPEETEDAGQSRRESVNRVGGHVRREVQAEDQEEGPREEERMRASNGRTQRAQKA